METYIAKNTGRIILFLLLAVSLVPSHGRKQWSEKQAWKWYEKTGVIKGFNQPERPYPGMSLEEMLKKAHEAGLNSVRFWISSNADDAVKGINNMKAAAKPYNITLSPVLVVPVNKDYLEDKVKDKEAVRMKMREYVHKVVGTFAKDKQVILWDIRNEPGQFGFDVAANKVCLQDLQLVSDIADWCYEENPIQPITSSIYWRGDILDENKNDLSRRCFEVEQKMDLHNFHDYACGKRGYTDQLMSTMMRAGHRPTICTECLTRVNGSGLGRTLPEFSKYNVGFYVWGLYANDANWEVSWGRSTYHPYEPPFHDLLYPDGQPYDWRDIDMLRSYQYGQSDPGVEYTDRWTPARAWRWMALGPVKGKVFHNVENAISWINDEPNKEYNSLKVFLQYEDYRKNAKDFFVRLDSLLKLAKGKYITVLPTLLTDENAFYPADELAKYEKAVIDRYYMNKVIQAWDLYYHPGETLKDGQLLSRLVRRLFQECRYAFANQPLTATPYVGVKPFKKDFDYVGALVHGRRNGWNMLQYEGGASDSLTYQIWYMSDVLSFSARQPAAESGWLMSLAFRFGRPVFCTEWQPQSEEDANKMLGYFGDSHIFWYQSSKEPMGNIGSFRFQPITTSHVAGN